MALFVHVLDTLSYVPFKELTVLCVYLQGGGSPGTMRLVAETFQLLTVRSPTRFRALFRDIGILAMLVDLVGDVEHRLEEAHETPRVALLHHHHQPSSAAGTSAGTSASTSTT